MTSEIQKIDCIHTPGVQAGYIKNCPFCGWENPFFKGGFVYKEVERNGAKK